MKAVTRREIDMVAAWSVDRLGRSLMDLLEFLKELHAKGVDLFLHQQGLDTSTPSGAKPRSACSRSTSRLRRSAARGATGLRRFRRRRAGGVEAARRRAGDGQVRVVARGCTPHPQERHG